MTLRLTQKQRFLTLAVIGAIAVPGLALLVPADRDIPSALVSMVLAGLLAGAGWFATILYADASVTGWFARVERANREADAADAAYTKARSELWDARRRVEAANLALAQSPADLDVARDILGELTRVGVLSIPRIDGDVVAGETVEVR